MSWFLQNGWWFVWIEDPISPTGKCGPFKICKFGNRPGDKR